MENYYVRKLFKRKEKNKVNMMRVLLLSQTDMLGGAARATYRLHQAFLKDGISSFMKVRMKCSDDPNIFGPQNKLGKIFNRLSIRTHVGKLLLKIQKTSNQNCHSINILPSYWHRSINQFPADVVNIHWVGGETCSIKDIGKIRKPLIWTLHDMWPFCGAEHYTDDGVSARWRSKYITTNRPTEEAGLDWNKKCVESKKKILAKAC